MRLLSSSDSRAGAAGSVSGALPSREVAMSALPTSVHINAVFLLGAMLAVLVSKCKQVSRSGQFQAVAVVLMLLGVAAVWLIKCLEPLGLPGRGYVSGRAGHVCFASSVGAMRMLLTKSSTRSTGTLTGCLGIVFKILKIFLVHTCPIVF